MNIFRNLKLVALVAAVAGFTVACSGIGGDPAPTPIAVSGPMTKGSIVVGGITFDDAQVSVSADESAQAADFLADGMTIRLLGTVNADGVTGVATSVEVENEVRGPVTAIDAGANTFTIFGFTVVVGGDTIFDDGDSFGGLAVNDIVGVYGFQLGDGSIRATRIDELSPGADFEVRGFLTDVTSSTFQIGGSATVFSYDGSTAIVGGASFAAGDLVEAEVNGALYASVVELEEVEDAEYYEQDEVEIEGVVTGFVDADTAFFVGGTRVRLTDSVKITGGDLENIRDGVVIEVEGGFGGTTLFATEVEFEDNVAIVATADAAAAAGMLGISVSASALTELDGLAAVGAIAEDNPLAIEGFVLSDGSVEAISIELMSEPVAASELVLQGPVTALVDSDTIEILGVTVDLGSASSFSDDGGPALNLADFVGRLQVGTVVEVEGSFGGGVFTALEAEID
jgi:hypothetical protein